MGIKNIYVHDGDLLVIHLVSDKEAKPSKTAWSNELRPRKMLLTIIDSVTVGYSDPSYQFGLQRANGTVLRWKQ